MILQACWPMLLPIYEIKKYGVGVGLQCHIVGTMFHENWPPFSKVEMGTQNVLMSPAF